MDSPFSLLEAGKLKLEELSLLAARPPLFEPGEPQFWTDPHISAQMLAAHLDPETDAASRKPRTIERMVDWLVSRLELRPGSRLLDLGCGPGLYCARFAELGLKVTGVDYSRRSIEYAREAARARGIQIEYVNADYVKLDYSTLGEPFDAAVLIYGDICTLPDDARDTVLAKAHAALRPGGYFAFDVMTPSHWDRMQPPTRWSAESSGFWRPSPHLLLEQTFDYPEDDVLLERYLVIEEDGKLTDYRIWSRLYTVDAIEAVLNRAGFKLLEAHSDLAGAPYNPDSEWLGLIAQKM